MTDNLKCPDCDFIAKSPAGLAVHSKKHNNESKALFEPDLPDPRYATKEDLNRINSSLDKLTEILTNPKPDKAMSIEQPTAKEIKPDVNPEKSDKSPVPPKWRQMVDEVLGTDFGINVVYPDSGAGFLFKLIVPLDKSNAAKDYLEMYKVDIRTKSVGYNEGIEGVRKFCELVKNNLKVNSNKPL